ncbi:cell surface protein [Candidatus Magnetomorum sp. HK-1]|nr:cell surface protein [Candidatus Magnetomorum sp. HK-1]
MKKGLWVGIVCFFVLHTYGLADEIILKHASTWQYQYATALDLDMDNNHLYLGTINTVVILDMNYPFLQKEINTINLDTTVSDLFYQDGYLFVANSDNGLIIFDVNDPSRPYAVRNESICNASLLISNGQYAGVISPCSNKGIDKNFAVYNMLSPQEPIAVNWLTLSGLSEIKDLFIENNLVYIIDMEEGITVYNWNDFMDTNVQDIQMLGVYDPPGIPKHIFVKNQFAYISDFETGFSIIDYTNPERPQDRSCKEDIEHAMGSAIVGNHAFVATYHRLLWSLNIENPDDIKTNEVISIPGAAYNVFAGNNLLYVSSYDQVYIYELRDGSPQPQFIATPQKGTVPLAVSYSNTSLGDTLAWNWDFGDGYTSSMQHPFHIYNTPGQYTVTLSVNYGNKWYSEIKSKYITVRELPPNALFESDINSGVAPVSIHFKQTSTGHITDLLWNFGDGHTSTENNPFHEYTKSGMYTVELTVFGPGGENTIKKVDYISVKNNVMQLSEWHDNSVSKFCIDNDRSIGFAATPQGIDILNIANPFDITIIKSITLKNRAESLYYSRSHLFAACGNDGMIIYNTSHPSEISQIVHLPMDGFANHVWVSNDYAYVSTITSGVSVISLLSNSIPQIISRLNIDGTAYAMKMWNQSAFIAEGEAGLFCYKQTSPVDFIQQSFFEANGRVAQFEFSPKGIFLVAEEAGLLILDFDDETNEMSKVGSAQDLMLALDVSVQKDYAFVACGPEGLRVLDVKSMEEPIEIIFYPSKDISTDVIDAFPYLYLADGKGGLRVFVQPETNVLSLNLPETIQEGSQAVAQVCLPYIHNVDLTVYMSSSHPQIISLPETITIQSGQLCSNFNFKVKENFTSQDEMKVQINAKAEGLMNASCQTLKTSKQYEKEYHATDLPIKIPDKELVESKITIDNDDKIKNLIVRLVIKHNQIEDIFAYLITPQQEKITLFTSLKVPKQTGIFDIELNDRALKKITDEKGQLRGSYKPQSPLSIVNGLSIKGEWKLHLKDNTRYDTGTLESWSLFCKLSDTDNEPPEARPDQIETDKKTAVKIPVLANDSDPNNDVLRITDVSLPKWGTVKIDSDQKQLIYTPLPVIEKALVDSFDYSISDGKEVSQSYVMIQIADSFICNDIPVTISPEGLTAEIIISSYNAMVQDLNVRVSIQHPDVSSLQGSLISPSLNRILLFEHVGEGKENIENALFNDEAKQMIDQAQFPLTGAFRPLETLSEFDKEPLNGKWQLQIINEGDNISGTLVSFQLQIFYLEEKETIQIVQKQNTYFQFQKLFKDNKSFNGKTKFFHQTKTILTDKPQILINEIPPLGNRIKQLKGELITSDSFSGNIVVYIHTDSWHLKPCMETALTYINSDNSWECDITTKPGDETASKIAVFLFSSNHIPLLMERLPVLPESYFQKAVSYEIRTRKAYSLTH